MINNIGYQRLTTKLNRRNYNESKPHTKKPSLFYYDHDHQFKVIFFLFLPFIYKFIHAIINRQQKYFRSRKWNQ